METIQTNQKDETLWQTAQKRAKFKSSLVSYLLVNAVLIAIWAFGDRDHFWPMYVMLFWGPGLAIKYFKAYHLTGILSAEKEYEKLKNENS